MPPVYLDQMLKRPEDAQGPADVTCSSSDNARGRGPRPTPVSAFRVLWTPCFCLCLHYCLKLQWTRAMETRPEAVCPHVQGWNCSSSCELA